MLRGLLFSCCSVLDNSKSVVRQLCANEIYFLSTLSKNLVYYHHKANDRYGIKIMNTVCVGKKKEDRLVLLLSNCRSRLITERLRYRCSRQNHHSSCPELRCRILLNRSKLRCQCTLCQQSCYRKKRKKQLRQLRIQMLTSSFFLVFNTVKQSLFPYLRCKGTIFLCINMYKFEFIFSIFCVFLYFDVFQW